MTIFISGGSSSGKSGIAETKAVNLHKEYKTDKLYYIATMHSYGKEGEERIKKHREMRFGKGFETLELYNTKSINEYHFDKNSTILLECMSNLLANEMYDEATDKIHIIENIIHTITNLISKCKNLVIVSNEIFNDYVFYDNECKKYIKNLGIININLVKLSDIAIESVYGVEIHHK